MATWDLLPFDLLAQIFSHLPPDSLAAAASSCTHWHASAAAASGGGGVSAHPPWFLAMNARDRAARCYAHNPAGGRWHRLDLDFCPLPVRPIAPISTLVLCRPLSPGPSLRLRLALCNPFARHYRPLPELRTPRANPAVGVTVLPAAFQIYVAGGMSEDALGRAHYSPTVEMYDSKSDAWQDAGRMPPEFAVRLTVWTASESVFAGGALYWITSARAYSVMGFEVGSGAWREVRAPQAERLECAALVSRSGRLALVGGVAGSGECCVWELRKRDGWAEVDAVPPELARRFVAAAEGSWANTKCVGSCGAIYLYRDLGAGMLVCREMDCGRTGGKWDWRWEEGLGGGEGGGQLPKSAVKGVIVRPSLAPWP